MSARNSTRTRRKCFEFWRSSDNKMICQNPACCVVIDPVQDRWEADHEVVREHGGSDDPPNVRPLCLHCHKEKTAKDAGRIAKARRQRDQNFGIKRSSRPMPFGRGSALKKKLNGQIVPRHS